MARWATVNEAADYLRVHPGTIRKLISCKEGVGGLFKHGPRIIVDLDEIDNYFKTGEAHANNH